MNPLKLFVLILPLIISHHQISAQPYKTLVAPIRKDTTTSLYTITLNSHQHYVIDLTAPLSWYNCSPPHPLVVCHSPPCTEAQSYPSPPGPHPTSAARTNPDIPCSCTVTPVNPVTKSCAVSRLTYTNINLRWTDGRTPTTRIDFNQVYISCAPASLFRSLPKGAFGLASLSSSPLSFSSQFTLPNLEIAKKFAICLPSRPSTPGVAFFGDGPYYILPPTNLDAETIVSYTPLLKKPNSPDFFIGVKSLAVDGRSIPIPISTTPTKLSTVVPYTTVRSDVYRYLKKSFSKGTGTAGVPRVKRVKPFDLCWNASALGFTRVGFRVPQIDLELGNGKNWTIFGSNSMKEIGGVACLAFVNGGEINDGSAVVIGSYQMENNFLLFDMEKSRLGFSSTLFFIRTSCGNFNFTTTTTK